MGFFERFKSAREAQQQKVELPGVKPGKEAEARGEKIRGETEKALKDTLKKAWGRVGGLGKTLASGASTIRRGAVSALDRAIGTPGLVVDVLGAGKQATKETARAGVTSVDKGATKFFTEFGKGTGDFVLAVENELKKLKKWGTETAQGVATGVEGGMTELVEGGTQTAKDVLKGMGEGTLELTGAFEKKANSVRDAIIIELQKQVSPERLGKIDPDSIMALANALAEQGVDAVSAGGKKIIEQIGLRWDSGVENVSKNVKEVDKGLEQAANIAESEVVKAIGKLVDRASAAKNKFLGWWNKSRIQDARISKLEEQNAQLAALVESQNTLLLELASVRPPRLERKTGEPFSVRETAS